MKRYLILLLFLFFYCNPVEHYQPHFNPPEGNPYLPMNIFVVEATIEGKQAEKLDEIAVFNKTLCYGARILDSTISKEKPLELIATADDGTGEYKNGFYDGDSLMFRVWDARDRKEYVAYAQFLNTITGEPINPETFEKLGTVAVILNTTGIIKLKL